MLEKMAEDLSKKKPISHAWTETSRKLLCDIKKLLTEQINQGVKHNLNSTAKVITKSKNVLKVLKKEIVDAIEDTDKITHIFIETTEPK